MSKPTWMVRAGREAMWIDDFIENGHVALGIAHALAPVPTTISRKELTGLIKAAHPDWKDGKASVAASQFVRFAGELKVGDEVVTYDPGQRRYYLGTIEGDAELADQREGEPWYRRRVRWQQRVKRDVLDRGSLNTLGAIQTLFRLSDEAAANLRAHARPLDAAEADEAPPAAPVTAKAPAVDPEFTAAGIAERAATQIEDRVSALDWEDLQQLVAGILRAMGYKTRVSPRGPDRGVDILASPDGLGLQEPRIFVEVKHRKGTPMGATDVRSFMGGMRSGSRCLYVSTGGFTKDAKYEAERSVVPLTLVDLTDLRRLLVEHYERLDEATRQLLPLTKVFWPVDPDA